MSILLFRFLTRQSYRLQLLDIHLHDHLIITDESYYSYADEGHII
ncbi:JAB domain-containing protein [Parabacteroides goldsteinii]|nr:JAB domain-containing protein [Parabacteroides goldsteinii]